MLISFLITIIYICSNPANSVTTLNVFAKHTYNRVFIETGCFEGDGVALALKAGYDVIYSIELSDILYEGCRERFLEYSSVHIMKGDSAIVLREILSKIDSPATFWLDGHFSGCCNNARGESNTPLLKELEIIGSHHVKNHTILIDDVRDLGSWYMDYIGIDIVLAKLRTVNAAYHIGYENGLVENDVLVASLGTTPSNHRNFSIEIRLHSDVAVSPSQFYFSAMDLENRGLMLEYCNKFCVKHELTEAAGPHCHELLLNKSIEIFESHSKNLCQGDYCLATSV